MFNLKTAFLQCYFFSMKPQATSSVGVLVLCSPEPNNFPETVIKHKQLRTKDQLGKVGSNLVTCHDPCSLSRNLRNLRDLSVASVQSL